jgi:N-acetylmuramoyl-L-alanine amidase
LVETAYLINPSDNALLVDDKFKKDCAKAIAEGIKTYVSGK